MVNDGPIAATLGAAEAGQGSQARRVAMKNRLKLHEISLVMVSNGFENPSSRVPTSAYQRNDGVGMMF